MAQLDNATDSDSGDRGFKSLWAGQKQIRVPFGTLICFAQRDLNGRSNTCHMQS